MNTSRIALTAAVTSLVAWIAKAVAIGVAGGHDLSSLESPLFLVGLAAQVVAVVALVLAFTRGLHAVVRVAAVVAALVAVMAAVTLIDEVIQRVQPADPSWIWVEINLWVMASLVLGLAIVATRPSQVGSQTRRTASVS